MRTSPEGRQPYIVITMVTLLALGQGRCVRGEQALLVRSPVRSLFHVIVKQSKTASIRRSLPVLHNFYFLQPSPCPCSGTGRELLAATVTPEPVSRPISKPVSTEVTATIDPLGERGLTASG